MEQFAEMTNEELTRLILCSLQDGHMVSPTYTAAVAELKRRQTVEKSDSINDFFSQLEEIKKSLGTDIEKGGEGSKGGKIIGHTKSGKPKYAKKEPSHIYHSTIDSPDAPELTHLGTHESERGFANAHFEDKEGNKYINPVANPLNKEGEKGRYLHKYSPNPKFKKED